ncbi:MAG: threonylcarbamoyl-AMP synthase [Crocinitomicaceae bacterium]|nr:threonylcarbamoyl-AMP synthase [Crocinitomicaceae bacterium]
MKTEISSDIAAASAWLKQGETVAIPTETVYGLAANALNPDAVLKIFEVKNRPTFDPLIVHIGNMSHLEALVKNVGDMSQRLAASFWPGPLTIIFSKNEIVPDIVTAGLSTVGIRMPNHSATLELLQTIDFPLAAPSANPFGYISPTTSLHVYEQLGEKIPFILEGGSSSVGVESTIVYCNNDDCTVLRLGGIPVEAIEEVIGKKTMVSLHSTSNPSAPGMLSGHYAPRKRLVIGDPEELLIKYSGQKAGILSYYRSYPTPYIEVLSPEKNLSTAAKNLYHSMRRLDSSECEIIFAEWVPDEGLGRAINDRLRRASLGSASHTLKV